MEEMLEERLQPEEASDVLVNLVELAAGEFFPARADGGVVAETVQEELDFAEGEAHFSGEANQEYARERVACIAALAAEALGWGKEATFFVVTDGGGVEARGAGELTNFHFVPFLTLLFEKCGLT